MRFELLYPDRRKRVAIFVSRYDHCLSELLWRWRRGELYADIPLVISNHAEMEREAARFDVRFEHVPVTPDTKPAAERAHLELLGGTFDLIVLARYMQILSPTFLEAYLDLPIQLSLPGLDLISTSKPPGHAAARPAFCWSS